MGLAEAQAPDALPILLWGRTHAHICLGASQSAAAELNPNVTLPVCQRPVGGGAVWLDEAQYCYVFIVPQVHLPTLPRLWFQWALAPVLATYHDFDMAATQVEHDIWLDGKKIGGSGAATINKCGVIAGSFLMHFPAEQFADCMSAPNSEFHEALVQGLKAAVTDWASHQIPPPESQLSATFQRRLESELGWHCEPSELTHAEIAARDEALIELSFQEENPKIQRRRRIKINALTFLNERNFGEDWVRVLARSGVIHSLELSIHLPAEVIAGLVNCDLDESVLAQRLNAHLPLERAHYWARIIYQTAAREND